MANLVIDGSKITFPDTTTQSSAAAATLGSNTLAANVTSSSLTSVGVLTALAMASGSNITFPDSTTQSSAAAATLGSNTLAANVTSSSLTSVGTLSSLAVSGGITVASNTYVKWSQLNVFNNSLHFRADPATVVTDGVEGPPTNHLTGVRIMAASNVVGVSEARLSISSSSDPLNRKFLSIGAFNDDNAFKIAVGVVTDGVLSNTTDTILYVKSDSETIYAGINPAGPVAATDLTTKSYVDTMRLTGYTVATLPAGTIGDRAYVTDALTPSFGEAVVAGGAVVIPVFRNATVWIVA